VEWAQAAVGLLFLVGIAVLWILAVVAIWPDGFLDTPFAAITFGMLLRVLGALFVLVLPVIVVWAYWPFIRDSH